MIKKLTVIIFSCLIGFLAAGEIPEAMTDPSDRETFQWLLERAGAEPEVHYKRDEVEWIGFKGESKYTCGLFLDENGHVVKAMFNKQAIDNEEMKKLAGFRHLEHINCQHNFGMDKGGPGTPRNGEVNILSGAGWIAFKDHPLEYMRLAGSPFDGDGLRAVAQIDALKTLNVFHTAVTDEDMVALRGHPNLEEVVVGPMWDDKITNKTVEHISHIPNLKRFKVVETYLSYDGGLEHLAKLGEQIESIDLGNTVVPPEDIGRLRKELPNAEIVHKPIPEIGQLILDNWKMPEVAGEDSFSFLSVFNGYEPAGPMRDSLGAGRNESGSATRAAFRPSRKSRGNEQPLPAASREGRAAESLLRTIRDSGRSRPR